MENLTITKESAVKAYNEASKNGKILLENLLGKKNLQLGIKDRIKTLDDAIEELGENDIEVVELRKLIQADVSNHILNHQMAVVIVKALNEGWVPEWDNSGQYKYFPWFRMGSSSGSGFSSHGYGVWVTVSYVGSRLCFKSRELAEYAGEQFLEIYKQFMII